MNRMVMLAWIGTLLGCGSVSAEEARPAVERVGVWAAEARFGPALEGPLLVRPGEKRPGEKRWSAELAGVEVSFRPDGDRIAFELPDGLGSFRGSVDGATLQGHWIQPPGTMLNNAYATPVRFEKVPAGWLGQVDPLDEVVHLFLVLQGRDDGTVGGFFRNPERNLGRWLRFASAVEGPEGVVLRDQDGNVQLQGVPRGEALSFYLPQAGRTLDFVRIAAEDRGFAPRPGTAPKTLERPPELGDGWSTAGMEEAGIDPGRILGLVEKVAAVEADSVSTPYLHSLLVARHGKLVVEEYFHGHHRDLPHDTRSAGKSFATALVGAAVHRGAPLTVETPVYEVLGKRAGPLDADPRRERLFLKHLLSMSPGLHCDDGDYDSPGNEDNLQSQEQEPDWIRYALRLPMVHEPGEHDAYCSAGMHLLAGLLGESTGRWVPELFDAYLARPMGFGKYYMNLDPTNEGYLGGGVYLLPRDFLKLGQVYLDGGLWHGRRILSEDWIERSVTPTSSLNEENDYGYGWWLATVPWRGRELRTFYASGNGGQLVIVVPELELVVAFQAANYADYRVWRKYREEWLPEHILEAVAGDPAP